MEPEKLMRPDTWLSRNFWWLACAVGIIGLAAVVYYAIESSKADAEACKSRGGIYPRAGAAICLDPKALR